MDEVKTRRVVSKVFLPDDEVDVEERARRIKIMEEYLVSSVADGCSQLVGQMLLWRDKNLWEDFADSWEQFCVAHLKRSSKWIQHVIDGAQLLKKIKPGDDPTLIEAHTASVKAAAEKADPGKVTEHGGTRNPNGKNQHSKIGTLTGTGQAYHDKLDLKPLKFRKYGTDSEYLAQRIAEVNPDIHERMKKGEYSSVRAAAMEAGVIKQRTQISWTSDADAQQIANRLFERIPEELLPEVLEILSDAVKSSEF